MASEESIHQDRENLFPNLKDYGYRKTSESTGYETIKYNCIAYAMDDDQRWWEPPIWGEHQPGNYWPSDAPTEHELNTYIRVFELQGYMISDTRDLEPNFEKVAIYWGVEGHHVAKQLASGEWSSKLGDHEDIAHKTLEGLETDGRLPAYGKVMQILKRPMGRNS